MMNLFPGSSVEFVALCAHQANRVDYGASLHRAVDGLHRFAVRHGLVDRLGQDIVQEVMADAFKHIGRRHRWGARR
jgi:DNA-directed RNA polymerase specialized sigma24 family protein